jgi:hypothetical protein
LQLDSTFSERDYSASTFRDFIEKMAAAGYVNLKQVDRSLLVELKDQFQAEGEVEETTVAAGANGQAVDGPPPPQVVSIPAPQAAVPPSPLQVEEGIRVMQEAFQNSKIAPHWPMYLRNVKQFIKNSSPAFDEHRYGFHSFLDAVRSGQRAGLFRLERNRQGILRVYPGNQISQMQRLGGMPRMDGGPAVETVKPYDVEDDITLQMPVAAAEASVIPDETEEEAQAVAEQPESESAVVEANAPVEDEQPEAPVKKRRVISGIKRKTVTPRKSATAGKRSRKKTTAPPDESSLT